MKTEATFATGIVCVLIAFAILLPHRQNPSPEKLRQLQSLAWEQGFYAGERNIMQAVLALNADTDTNRLAAIAKVTKQAMAGLNQNPFDDHRDR